MRWMTALLVLVLACSATTMASPPAAGGCAVEPGRYLSLIERTYDEDSEGGPSRHVLTITPDTYELLVADTVEVGTLRCEGTSFLLEPRSSGQLIATSNGVLLWLRGEAYLPAESIQGGSPLPDVRFIWGEAESVGDEHLAVAGHGVLRLPSGGPRGSCSLGQVPCFALVITESADAAAWVWTAETDGVRAEVWSSGMWGSGAEWGGIRFRPAAGFSVLDDCLPPDSDAGFDEVVEYAAGTSAEVALMVHVDTGLVGAIACRLAD